MKSSRQIEATQQQPAAQCVERDSQCQCGHRHGQQQRRPAEPPEAPAPCHACRAGSDAGIALLAAQQRLETQEAEAEQHQHATEQVGGRAVIDRLELVDDRGGKGGPSASVRTGRTRRAGAALPAARRRTPPAAVAQDDPHATSRTAPAPATPPSPRASDRADGIEPRPANSRMGNRPAPTPAPRPIGHAARAPRWPRRGQIWTKAGTASGATISQLQPRANSRSVRSVSHARLTASTIVIGSAASSSRKVLTRRSATFGRKTSSRTVSQPLSMAIQAMKPSGTRLSNATIEAANNHWQARFT